MLSISDPDIHKVGTKLHKQFGHPSSEKLIKLLRDARVNNKSLENKIREVSDSCEVCLKYKKPVPRPIVALPIAKKFNDVVAMDLKVFGSVYFLVLVDHATRYCASVVINDKKPATIVQSLFLMWISLFGPPSKILSDNGGEFQNPEMRQLGETFNIKLLSTAAQAAWSNGICERLNGILAQSVRKIMDDSNCDIKTALAWAVSARNTLDNFSGFAPSQLVFGYNTILPNVLKSSPPGLEEVDDSAIVRNNLNAMYSARQQFLKAESSDKLRRALKHNVREGEGQTVEMGDSVYYKRIDDAKWRGPGVVIGRDGKQVLVKHGGQLVRVHVCRLASRSKIQSTPLPNQHVGEPVDMANPPPCGQIEPEDSDSDDDKCNSSVSDSSGEEEGYDTPNELIESDAIDSDDKSAKVISPSDLRVGHRIQGTDIKTGKVIDGKIISRAGKASSKNHKFCFNLKKNDNTVEWYDMSKDISDLKQVSEHEEMLVLFNNEVIIAAKEQEIKNWQDNQVYTEVEDKGQPVISVRWVITEKLKNGKPVVKARLVARGFEEDSSELEKFSPTCLKESVKITLAIASAKKWKLHTLDIRSAYLQGNPMQREVYLKPPSEYDTGKLWRLQKCVYGLSDAARSWYDRVRRQLVELGLKVCSYDNAVFSYLVDGKLEGVLCLYVDDFLLCGTDAFMDNIVSKIPEFFTVGNAEQDTFKYIGLNIVSGHHQLSTIDQIQYCNILEPMKLSRGRLNNRLSDLSKSEKTEFRSLIGQLNWVATQSRPDIAFDVCDLSGRVKNAKVADVLQLNKVVAKVTTNSIKIAVPNFDCIENCFLECYSDSSYANLPGGGSQGGLIIFLKDQGGNRCPIFWQSRKIRRVVKSTLAAETLALLECSETAFFIAKIISDLVNIPPRLKCSAM